MLLGLLDPDPLVGGIDLDPSIINKNWKIISLYLQKVINGKLFLKSVFCWRLEGQ
jgi:hypothetical protein